jgi:hypothetical protein
MTAGTKLYVCWSPWKRTPKTIQMCNVSSSVFYVCCSVASTAFVVYWSEFLATDPEVRVRYSALPDFLRNSESGTGSTQSREYNGGATRNKKYRLRSRNSEYGRRDTSRWPSETLYPRKFALTSLTSGGCWVDMVRSRTEATEFSF